MQFFKNEVGKKQEWLIAAGIVISSAVILLGWGYWTENMGIGEAYIKSFSDYSGGAITIFILPMFAVLNSFAEEVTYRGIFQEAASRSFNSPIWILLFQALPFAALHSQTGSPNGAMGYIMTMLYGVGLGYLRMKTGSILLPVVAHIFVDLLIGYFLYFKFLY